MHSISYSNVILSHIGVLDKATVKLINTDRCGVKDPNPRQKRLDAEEKLRTGRSGRYRRFNHQGTKWKNVSNESEEKNKFYVLFECL